MDLRWRIEQYIKASGTTATKFGRDAARDPRLVHDLRRGREMGPAMTARLSAWLDAHGDRA